MQAYTRKVRMNQGERIAWALAVMLTLGLALPLYWIRLRSFRGRTVTEYR